MILSSVLVWAALLPSPAARPPAREAAVAIAAAPARTPFATRELLRRVRASGRAEATIRVSRPDPVGGAPVTSAGTLVLEPPGFARLDLDDGERLTLRPDGGDWLQPATKQLVRAGAQSAGGFLGWWGALLDPRGAGLVERRAGPRRYALERPGGDLTQIVELGPDGLPRRVSVSTGAGEPLEYRVTRWRFPPARGRGDFTLEPPAGFEVVEMP